MQVCFVLGRDAVLVRAVSDEFEIACRGLRVVGVRAGVVGSLLHGRE